MFRCRGSGRREDLLDHAIEELADDRDGLGCNLGFLPPQIPTDLSKIPGGGRELIPEGLEGLGQTSSSEAFAVLEKSLSSRVVLYFEEIECLRDAVFGLFSKEFLLLGFLAGAVPEL